MDKYGNKAISKKKVKESSDDEDIEINDFLNDEKTIDKFFLRHNINAIHKLLNNKILPTHKHVKLLLVNYNASNPLYNLDKIFILLNCYNYNYTNDDIIEFTKAKIDISKYVNFEEKLKDEQLEKTLEKICNEKNFFVPGIKMTLTGFKINMKTFTTVKKMIDCIEKNNIIPDMECVHILAKISGKNDCIKYLFDKYAFKLDFQSVYNAYHSTKNKPNTSFTYLFEKYYEENKNKN